ncbi:hypothetical protein [Taklimakanibacter deserti]|uniref:hypothetical protein n=1 Tax=Taklimakanibacter deserti TaxID=2267839 RepID=UPI000E647F0A
MLNIKTLLMAAAVSTGVALPLPAASQAMPASAPVKMQTAQDGNLVQVYHKKKWRKNYYRKGKWRESRRWRHNRRWARYCDPWDGCYRRRHARFYRSWDEPYYGYGYGGYYGPGFYGPGIGLQFRID